jgi:hypothetical protein
MKSALGAFLVIVGWLMITGGLLFGIIISGFMTEAKISHLEQIFANIIIWSIPIAGLLLVLFSDKIVGYKNK